MLKYAKLIQELANCLLKTTICIPALVSNRNSYPIICNEHCSSLITISKNICDYVFTIFTKSIIHKPTLLVFTL